MTDNELLKLFELSNQMILSKIDLEFDKLKYSEHYRERYSSSHEENQYNDAHYKFDNFLTDLRQKYNIND